MSQRRALSPVVASVILSGMVLVIGGAVWSYSYGAASTMANDYADETITIVHTIIERFSVEKVDYNSGTEIVTVWLYNYGSIAVNVDTTIKIGDNTYYDYDRSVVSGKLQKIEIDVSPEPILSENQEITITIRSDRDNAEYETYYVQ